MVEMALELSIPTGNPCWPIQVGTLHVFCTLERYVCIQHATQYLPADEAPFHTWRGSGGAWRVNGDLDHNHSLPPSVAEVRFGSVL